MFRYFLSLKGFEKLARQHIRIFVIWFQRCTIVLIMNNFELGKKYAYEFPDSCLMAEIIAGNSRRTTDDLKI